jgi:hypothetical protein
MVAPILVSVISLVSVETMRNRAAGSILKVMDGTFIINGCKQDVDDYQK